MFLILSLSKDEGYEFFLSPRPLFTASPPNLARMWSMARSAAARLSLKGSSRLAGSASSAELRLEIPTPKQAESPTVRLPLQCRLGDAKDLVGQLGRCVQRGAAGEELEARGLEFQHHGASRQAIILGSRRNPFRLPPQDRFQVGQATRDRC